MTRTRQKRKWKPFGEIHNKRKQPKIDLLFYAAIFSHAVPSGGCEVSVFQGPPRNGLGPSFVPPSAQLLFQSPNNSLSLRGIESSSITLVSLFGQVQEGCCGNREIRPFWFSLNLTPHYLECYIILRQGGMFCKSSRSGILGATASELLDVTYSWRVRTLMFIHKAQLLSDAQTDGK